MIIKLMYDSYSYIFAQSAFFNLSHLSFVWKETSSRNYGPVNATDSLRTPLCILLSFGRAFGSANRKDQKFRSEIGQCSVSVMFTHT